MSESDRPILFNPQLERALRRAAIWHAGQTRKGTNIPYVEHLVAAAMVLDRVGFDEDVVIAGLLHDAVEDAGASRAEIAEEFGPRVAEFVNWCTETKLDDQGRKRPWADRKKDHLDSLAKAPTEAKGVVLADKLHNLAAILIDLADGRDVWSLFNAPRDQVLWYYRASIELCGQGDPRLERLGAECRAILAKIENATPA
ncbi:MAG: HD domain-containing protein [Isosphaeraceae bacterium]